MLHACKVEANRAYDFGGNPSLDAQRGPVGTVDG